MEPTVLIVLGLTCFYAQTAKRPGLELTLPYPRMRRAIDLDYGEGLPESSSCSRPIITMITVKWIQDKVLNLLSLFDCFRSGKDPTAPP